MKRINLLLGVFTLISLLSVVGVCKVYAEENKCDMKKIETAYKCPECEDIYSKAGNCNDCSEEDKAVILTKIKACVKTGYTCDDCFTESLKPGKCGDCDKALTAVTVKAEVKTKGDKKTCADSGTFPHVSK
jgi:hypothetical protein